MRFRRPDGEDAELVRALEALHPADLEPVAPPPALRPPRVEAAHRAPRVVLRPTLAVALAVALLAIGAGAGLLLGDRGSGGPAADGPPVRLAALPGVAGATGDAVMLDHAHGMRVHVGGLPAAASGSFYEVWLLGPDGTAVAVGSLPVAGDGSASATFPLGVDPGRYERIDVSLEPGDGDPAHSGRSVLRSARL